MKMSQVFEKAVEEMTTADGCCIAIGRVIGHMEYPFSSKEHKFFNELFKPTKRQFVYVNPKALDRLFGYNKAPKYWMDDWQDYDDDQQLQDRILALTLAAEIARSEGL